MTEATLYRSVLAPIDNSPYAAACIETALAVAQRCGAAVTGCHIYPARLHDARFRLLEGQLPARYRGEAALQHQRATHADLIGHGLELISQTYLEAMARHSEAAGVPFTPRALEGRHWQRLLAELDSGVYDLVVLGAHGHGASTAAVSLGSAGGRGRSGLAARDSAPDGLIGSVCERVLRRARVDTLVVRRPRAPAAEPGHAIVVGVDGSSQSFGALQAALALGAAFECPVEVVATYDPALHHAIFGRLRRTLTLPPAPGPAPEGAAGDGGAAALAAPPSGRHAVFRLHEQERLHNEIIDRGLAGLYRSHLRVARALAAAGGRRVRTQLRRGQPHEQLRRRAVETSAWLIVVGRTGLHGGEELDLGSCPMRLAHLAPCDVLVTSRPYEPPAELIDGLALRWTAEARAALRSLPSAQRASARQAALGLARREGHSVVTTDVVERARALELAHG
ncbi:MAG: universal stress protein [Chloroflexi bacterium]|nr:universal stress protein [Chloroflexota bacterium]